LPVQVKRVDRGIDGTILTIVVDRKGASNVWPTASDFIF
jgi:hypothetical protein